MNMTNYKDNLMTKNYKNRFVRFFMVFMCVMIVSFSMSAYMNESHAVGEVAASEGAIKACCVILAAAGVQVLSEQQGQQFYNFLGAADRAQIDSIGTAISGGDANFKVNKALLTSLALYISSLKLPNVSADGTTTNVPITVKGDLTIQDGAFKWCNYYSIPWTNFVKLTDSEKYNRCTSVPSAFPFSFSIVSMYHPNGTATEGRIVKVGEHYILQSVISSVTHDAPYSFDGFSMFYDTESLAYYLICAYVDNGVKEVYRLKLTNDKSIDDGILAPPAVIDTTVDIPYLPSGSQYATGEDVISTPKSLTSDTPLSVPDTNVGVSFPWTAEKVRVENQSLTIPEILGQILSNTIALPTAIAQSISIALTGSIADVTDLTFDSKPDFKKPKFDLPDSDNWKTLVHDLTKIFPFCLPFDMLRGVQMFSEAAQNFTFDIDLDTSLFNIHHSVNLVPFKIPILFFRFIVDFWFGWILISRTRDLIKW